MSTLFMVFKKFFPAFIAVLLLFNFESAKANNLADRGMKSRNPYLITNIFSSAEEPAPSDSRAKAIIKANRIAFLVLLRNLGVDESFSDKISDETIDGAVYSRQIDDERIAGNYYSAKFNIAFLKSTISGLVEDDSVERVERVKEENFLLIPIQIEDGQEIMWERNNFWRKALEQSINVANAQNIILPAGDYNDMVNINLKNIKTNNFNDFSPTMNRYGADSVIIAYFEIDDIENKAIVTLNIFRALDSKKIRLSFVNSKNLSKNGLYLEVADRAVRHITQSEEVKVKKPDYEPAIKSNTKAVINVEIENLGDWMAIESRIRKMNSIKNLTLQSITRDSVRILVEYENSSGFDIIPLFASNNLSLSRGKNGEYFLSNKNQ